MSGKSCKAHCLLCLQDQQFKINYSNYHGLCRDHDIPTFSAIVCVMCNTSVPVLFYEEIKILCEFCSKNGVQCLECNKIVCNNCNGYLSKCPGCFPIKLNDETNLKMKQKLKPNLPHKPIISIKRLKIQIHPECSPDFPEKTSDIESISKPLNLLEFYDSNYLPELGENNYLKNRPNKIENSIESVSNSQRDSKTLHDSQFAKDKQFKIADCNEEKKKFKFFEKENKDIFGSSKKANKIEKSTLNEDLFKVVVSDSGYFFKQNLEQQYKNSLLSAKKNKDKDEIFIKEEKIIENNNQNI